jgi:hypothetical protein
MKTVCEKLAVQPATSRCHHPVTEPTSETFASAPNRVAECSLLLARCLAYPSTLEIGAAGSFGKVLQNITARVQCTVQFGVFMDESAPPPPPTIP